MALAASTSCTRSLRYGPATLCPKSRHQCGLRPRGLQTTWSRAADVPQHRPCAQRAGQAGLSRKPASASRSDSSGSGQVELLFGIAVSGGVFLAMQIAVLLAQLALVDAAFSGDWSRIGVISTDTELLLQKVCYFIFIAHSVTAAIAANMAGSKGLSPAVTGIKGMLFGTMEIWRVKQLPTKA